MSDQHPTSTAAPPAANQGQQLHWLAQMLTSPAHRAARATLLGLIIGGLAGGGMYVHDGSSLGTAALGFAGFWVLGFVLGYFPILAAIGSLLSIGV